MFLKTKKVIAIYSRKSKSTDRGESIITQIKICEEYIKKNYYDEEIQIIYYNEGEGKSGADSQRIKFNELMKDAKNKKYNILMCYRLDRVARCVSDFSDLIDELTSYNISFISVKEQFDTTTPMGRAMMYIASVFAQLEREIVAERIKDNLTELAKSGRWLGGVTPTGYKSVGYETIQIKELNENNEIERKRKRVYKLEKQADEAELIELLFRKIEEFKSLTMVETYLLNNNIFTKNGKRYTRFTLSNIYRNIVYAKNDTDMYKYLRDNNIEVFATKQDFDGKQGMIAYNKTKQQKHKSAIKNKMEEWIISVGKHEGYIEGKTWISIQNILNKNQNKRYRRPRKNRALLSGILKCKCSGYMRPKISSGRTDIYGNDRFFYMCEIKELSKLHKCNIKNIDGNELDRELLLCMEQWHAPNYKIVKELKTIENDKYIKTENEIEIDNLNKLYKKNERNLKNLIDRIKYIDINLIDDINKEIVKIKEENNQIQEKVSELMKKQKNYGLKVGENEIEELTIQVIENSFKTFSKLDILEQRNILKTIILNASWNGEYVQLEL